MPASFGLLLPTREMVMNGQSTSFRRIVELAQAAETSGFDSVWVGDSVLARPRFEPLTTLAAVAAVTKRVQLGTAVLLPALHNPVVLANQIANLDLIAEGRLILGLGTAARGEANQREFEAIGVPFRQRIGRFDEGIEVMRRLWSEPEVSYRGRHFQLDGVRAGLRPFREDGIPVWLSASEDASFRRILSVGAQGWFMLAPNASAFAAGWQRLQELALEAGKDVSALARAVYVTLDIDEDESAADKRMRAFVESYYNGRYEELVTLHAVRAGSPKACAVWLQSFIDAGATTVIVRFNQSDQSKQIRGFRRNVLPLLAKID